ncbi:hypothetical protein Q4511_00560 [Paracoccus sp. 1_MG-2023]|uniref:hypothetical protein n=1 Tax=unclassified Paracoccus (in: a-proteobacteria) TaxID=2688777 RepID=UPI001C099510|nr:MULTISPECIES: hypothetical protein [unclassified Paracoccus (in: a-proteobacteria)]MBU2957751.1 hypothetical protein [Paracoccus sp. C2R09]MDO6667401.1 hypothetical protein [Paracoccus sp. 1_MG-2023]
MAERIQSKDGSRDTDRILGKDTPETPGHGGREGGSLARAIGSEDEMKRAGEKPAGTTRPRKADEHKPGTSNLGEENR